MYCKYNAVLRDIGHLHQSLSVRSTQSEKEISHALHMYQRQREHDERETFPGHTQGNLYTYPPTRMREPSTNPMLGGAFESCGRTP